jgi:hypothetical protein
MVLGQFELSETYWDSLEINQTDIDFLYNFLLEKETPLTSSNLAKALISERIRSEKEKLQKKQDQKGEIYFPKLDFSKGDKIQFPALNWISGEVKDIRQGNNPEYPTLKVMTVLLEDGQSRQFALTLDDHKLNNVTNISNEINEEDEKEIIEAYGERITKILEEKLSNNKDIIRIGDRWFPKSLLIDFNVGHLNLAEAVLDMHGGGPLPVDALLAQIDLETDDPEALVQFSFNFALQEDPRFDEVGPSGIFQWFLNRLEPQFVREKPIELKYDPVEYDRSSLSEDMLIAEQNIDDELTESQLQKSRKMPNNQVSIILSYPHWRVGSMPLTPFTKGFFPTALESPRVKFKFIDHQKHEISAWVVRPYDYVYGLRDWYEEFELMPGSIINIRRGKEPGQVLIEPQKKRSNREWIRTLLIGADGGVVFALLKQTIAADYNERMAIAIPAVDALDELWRKNALHPHPFKKTLINTMRELAKLNPQGHVHSVELYSALNCIRRCPPGLVFNTLASNPEFDAVGDLYYRLNENS